MSFKNPAVRIFSALVMGLAISVITLKTADVFPLAKDGFVPSSFVTHTSMWGISLLVILILAKGKLKDYGFTKGRFRFTPRIFLWVIPTAILSVMGFLASRLGEGTEELMKISCLQDILFVWIYASISEEIFTRGLLQSFLSSLKRYGINLSNKLRLSLPVLFSGLFFGFMHVVLIGKLGPAALFVIILTCLLGIVAGYYRERTGSLIPAIIIHVLFNVGGMLPMWLLS